MPRLTRLWPLLLLVAACLPWTALAWLVEAPDVAQAPADDVPVLVQAAAADAAAGPRLRFRGGELRARLRFTLPAAADGERRVLWLSRDGFDAVQVAAPGWAPAAQGFFEPGPLRGLLPAGYGFALPRDWTGPREVQLLLRGGVRAAPTPRVLDESQVLALLARDNALAYAVYAALVTLAIAALALYAAVRDGTFLLFALHAGAALLVCATVNGHLYGVPGLGLLGRLGAPGFWGTLLLFAGMALLTVLRYAGTAGRGMRLAPWVLLAAAVPMAAFGGAWPQALHPLATAGWMVAAAIATVAVCGAARRGVSMAVAVLLALLLLATAAGAHELMQAGLLADGLWSRYGYQLAVVLLSLLLFVGLSSRIGQVRRRLDDEASARRDSEQRLRHERQRAALAQALQAELRSAPDDAIATTAFRLLAEHAARLAGHDVALVLAEGYRGGERLLVPGAIVPRALLQAVDAATPTLRACAGQRTASHVRLHGAAGPEAPAVACAVVPLGLPAPAWGALLVPASGEVIDDEDLAALGGLARTALEQADEALAAIELRRTAEHDGLTGTLNRRSLDLLLAGAFRAGHGAPAPLSVLFIDLDWFKRVNDTRGHACGDACLREVAAALRSELRPGDALGRYGGEEFLVVLPGHDAAAARVVAERLRETVERLALAWQGEPLQLTVSIGLAARRAEDADAAALLARADKALYAAKHEGRNCVRVAPAYAG